MKRIFIGIVLGLSSSLIISVVAKTVDSTKIQKFQAGDVLVDQQLNGNFDELTVSIDDNANQIAQFNQLKTLFKSYDYHDYIAADNIQSKTYDTDACTNGATSTWSYQRVTQGNIKTITRTQVRTDITNNNVCRTVVATFESTPTALRWIRSFVSDGVNPETDTLLNPAPALFLTNMRRGQSWGDVTNKTNAANDKLGVLIDKRTLLAVEDVSLVVNGNQVTYTECLKIHTLRANSNTAGLARISWRCPGIGMVKRIHTNLSGTTSRTWTLTNISNI